MTVATEGKISARMQPRYLLELEIWPAPGSEDTELRCLMEQEADHGEAEVYAGV